MAAERITHAQRIVSFFNQPNANTVTMPAAITKTCPRPKKICVKVLANKLVKRRERSNLTDNFIDLQYPSPDIAA